jgi:heme-degrading monooxygenase HmoA
VFARVVRYSVEPERCEEALASFEEAARQIREIDGMLGVYVMADGESGRIITLTLWEDRATMEASEVRASALRQQAVRPVEGAVESVERLRVAHPSDED